MARLLLLLTILFTLAGAAPAAGEWSPPFDVSPPEWGEVPRAAFDPAGNATVVWWGQNSGGASIAQARRIDPSGALGPVLDVSPPGEGNAPQVAVDAAGVATVVWIGVAGTDTVVRARRIDAAGALGPAVDLSDGAIGDAFAAHVAVDAAGNATVVWALSLGGSYVMQGRRLDAAGALGPVLDLSDPGPVVSDAQVVLYPDGDALAAWRYTDASSSRVQVRRITPTGTLSAIVDLSAPGDVAVQPRVAVDPAGGLVAVWRRFDGLIQGRRGIPGAGLRPIVDLSEAGFDARQPQLALDADGDVTVVWNAWDGTQELVQLRRFTAAGGLDATATLGPGEVPRVAVDADGDATVVWIAYGSAGDQLVRARSAAADGTLGAAVDLSPAGGEEILAPSVHAAPSGDPLALWTYYDDPVYRAAAARFTTPEPPAPSEPPVPPEPPVTPPEPPAAPPAPGPAPGPAAPLAPAPADPVCAPVTAARLSGVRPRPPRRGRVKGVAARLTAGGARLELVSARLAYRAGGRRRVATLPATTSAALRVTLPRRLARRLALGRRVRLVVQVRPRGCAGGPLRTLSARTTVVWVAKPPAR